MIKKKNMTDKSLTLKPVLSRKDLKTFVKLPFQIYRNNSKWVPELISQEMIQFNSEKNPVFEKCRAKFFVVWRNSKPAGRIAAIVSESYIERWNRKCGRFGWFESENDPEVASMLFKAAENWLVEQGMEEISGPLGFTDNDQTGFLVEGFDELPSLAGSYNHPYYNDFITSSGYKKEVDYVEYRITVPEKIPDRVVRLADLVKKRSSVRILENVSRKNLAKKWGKEVFNVINESYSELYGTTPLTEKQIQFYIDSYLGHVDPDFIKLAVDKDQLVGFVIAMPNLSSAFQKANGRLFPFGFFHILRQMKTSRVLDFYLAGILSEYQNTGVDLLLMYEMGKTALSRGMLFAESNREMEENKKIQAMWKFYDKRLHRRTRVYNKKLV